MDELFEATFSTFKEIEINSKVKPICGKCKRYMKYIQAKPSRLYCNICEETYRLPVFNHFGGKIRVFYLFFHSLFFFLSCFRLIILGTRWSYVPSRWLWFNHSSHWNWKKELHSLPLLFQ